MAQAGETQTTHFSFPVAVLRASDRKLAGQVLGADSKPVPGAAVSIGVNAQSGWRPTDRTTTDTQGRFSFDAVAEGTFQMIVNGQRAGYGSSQVQGGDTNVVFRFRGVAERGAPNPQTVTTSGTVFDPSGAPDPGVTLWLAPSGIAPDTKTDASGKFAVSWRPIQSMETLFVGRDLERNFATTVSIDRTTTNVDLHLQGGLALSGSVQDNNGAALKAATVRLFITGPGMSAMFIRQPATVDEQGAFAFSVLPRGQTYSVNAIAPGFASTFVKIGADQTQTASLQLPPIKLQPADRPLEGQVVGPDDKSVPGATVQVSGQGQPTASTRTDANGRFALKVCEGLVTVYASAPRNTEGSQPGSGNVQAHAGDLNVVVKLRAQAAVPAAVPRVNGQVPTNSPPPAPLLP